MDNCLLHDLSCCPLNPQLPSHKPSDTRPAGRSQALWTFRCRSSKCLQTFCHGKEQSGPVKHTTCPATVMARGKSWAPPPKRSRRSEPSWVASLIRRDCLDPRQGNMKEPTPDSKYIRILHLDRFRGAKQHMGNRPIRELGLSNCCCARGQATGCWAALRSATC